MATTLSAFTEIIWPSKDLSLSHILHFLWCWRTDSVKNFKSGVEMISPYTKGHTHLKKTAKAYDLQCTSEDVITSQGMVLCCHKASTRNLPNHSFHLAGRLGCNQAVRQFR